MKSTAKYARIPRSMYFNYYTHREMAHLKLPQKHTSEMNQLCLTDGEKVSYLRGIDFNRPISDCGAMVLERQLTI